MMKANIGEGRKERRDDEKRDEAMRNEIMEDEEGFHIFFLISSFTNALFCFVSYKNFI